MKKIIKTKGINSMDIQNLYTLNHLTLELWIRIREAAPDANFHFANMNLYIIKMLVFKCIEMAMDELEIQVLFGINEIAYDKDYIKYCTYTSGKKIEFPNFIVGIKSVSEICHVIKKYLDSQKQYDKKVKKYKAE